MSHYENAVKIVQKLVSQGYIAYFAGGWVRDHLMGNDSDDIDIATSAEPAEILKLFPHTVAVGAAFGVIIVLMEGHPFEVATFRRDMEYVNGRTPSRIEWCAPREDALRRDFTINGMFYDPIEHKIYDYVGGAEDIKRRVIRTIGDPYERFGEDRLRMVRAFRFSLRFGFVIDKFTQEAIRANADTLFPSVAMERVWQEFQKMAKYEHLDSAFIEMMRLDVLPIIFPALVGRHLNDLKSHVHFFNLFPKKSPAILYVVCLFPESTKEELQEMARNLRVSGDEIDLIETLFIAKELLKQDQEEKLPEWVAYFARRSAGRVLETLLAKSPERDLEREKKERFVETYREHIQRAKEKRPLITGKMLQDEGIRPGKDMGRLIKEGEKIAIRFNLRDPYDVLAKLKNTPEWK